MIRRIFNKTRSFVIFVCLAYSTSFNTSDGTGNDDDEKREDPGYKR